MKIWDLISLLYHVEKFHGDVDVVIQTDQLFAYDTHTLEGLGVEVLSSMVQDIDDFQLCECVRVGEDEPTMTLILKSSKVS